MSYNLSILSKFPAVQSFSMDGWGQWLRHEPNVLAKASSVLPDLRQYTGLCATMALFLRPTLTHLTIEYCSPVDLTAELHRTLPLDLAAQLQRARGPNGITSFTAILDDLYIAMLDTICEFFPRVTELRTDVTSYVEQDEYQDINPRMSLPQNRYSDSANVPSHIQATMFFDALMDISTLPATLERLALTWDFEYDEPEEALTADFPAFADEFLFHWRRLLDGSEVETTAEDAGLQASIVAATLVLPGQSFGDCLDHVAESRHKVSNGDINMLPVVYNGISSSENRQRIATNIGYQDVASNAHRSGKYGGPRVELRTRSFGRSGLYTNGKRMQRSRQRKGVEKCMIKQAKVVSLKLLATEVEDQAKWFP
ncbi:hypothetical protein B0H14DRAFT_2611419 [Mycena olivaceomarginata]|nr:hypothetical protein B0H14DRAFT_2611419 [Mycena olivaceomarginata]